MYDTYVNNGVTVADGTVIKFTGNNYNHITVDTNGYFVLPETANKITFKPGNSGKAGKGHFPI